MSGDGMLEKTGAGTLVLSGTGTQTGTTTVSAGTLIVNGDHSAATGAIALAAGTTLGGNGVIGGDTTINGTLSTGELASSGSVGTLDFNGNDLTFNNGSSWLVDLVQGATESSDSIFVDALTINTTSTLDFGISGLFNGDESYTLATYSSLSGTFSNYETSGEYTIGGNRFLLNYGTNTLTLTAVPEPGTFGILGFALGGVIYRRLRRRPRKS
jgi:fibronectin-binding autotransporter adhesin